MVSFTWHTACLLSLVAACDKAATCTDTFAASRVVVLHLPASSSPSATTTVPSAWHVTDQEKPRVVSAHINGTAEWTRTVMRGGCGPQEGGTHLLCSGGPRRRLSRLSEPVV